MKFNDNIMWHVTVVFKLTLGLAIWFLSILFFSKWLEPMVLTEMSDNIRLILRQMMIPYTVGLAGFYLITGKMEKIQPKSEQTVCIHVVASGYDNSDSD